LFLSTTHRGHGASTQLDASEAQTRLHAASKLAETLSDAATRHLASPLSAAQGLHQLQANLGSTDQGQPPAFAQPLMLIDSNAGISSATPASSVMMTGEDLTMTSTSSIRITAAEAFTLAAAQSASLFTHAGGIKAITGKDAVSVRAHTGALDALADQAVTITSSNGRITVQAKQEILLTSGGGYIRLTGKNIDIHCPASVSIKGVTHGFLGAASKTPESIRLPDTRNKLFDEVFVLKDKESGEPLVDHVYRIKRADGSYEYGRTDARGKTHAVLSDVAEQISIEVL